MSTATVPAAATSKHERLCWRKSAEREWDVSLVVVEEHEEAVQGCEVSAAQPRQKPSRPDQKDMTFESLNVRLTRSSPSISWGFELAQHGSDLVVIKLDPGSMAEKAGICQGDTVQEILNQRANNLSAALQRLQSVPEITMTLRRLIKDSPSLSWVFHTSPESPPTVAHRGQSEQIAASSDSQTKGFINSFTSQSKTPVNQIGERFPYNTTTHCVESNSNWNQNNGNVTRHYESKRTYTRTESSSVPPETNQSRLNSANAHHQQQQFSDKKPQKSILEVDQQQRSESKDQKPQKLVEVGNRQDFTSKFAQQRQDFMPNQQNFSTENQRQQSLTGSQQNFVSGFNKQQKLTSTPTQLIQQRPQEQQKQQCLSNQDPTQPNQQQQYPQFPQNQYNDQLKSVQQWQQRPVAFPEDEQKRQHKQQNGLTQHGRQTAVSQIQKQPRSAPLQDFSASYGNQQQTKSQPNFSMSQSAEPTKQQNQQYQYQINQYEQTDTINLQQPQQQDQKGHAVSVTHQQAIYNQQNQQNQHGQYRQEQKIGYDYCQPKQQTQSQFDQSYKAQNPHFHSQYQQSLDQQGQYQQIGQNEYRQNQHSDFNQQERKDLEHPKLYPQQNRQSPHGQASANTQNNHQYAQADPQRLQLHQQNCYQQLQHDIRTQDYPNQDRQDCARLSQLQQQFIDPHRDNQISDRSLGRAININYRKLPHRSRSQPRCCSRSEVLPGPVVYYIAPQPRTYRELSPLARVRYLQYNSPLDLYSEEAAAEAYYQHTDQPLRFVTSNSDQFQRQERFPLQSELQRIVSDEDRGMQLQATPPQQSASLKRIARAVGVQLD